MKKILALILCLSVMLLSFGGIVFAEEAQTAVAEYEYSKQFNADFAEAKGLLDMLAGMELLADGNVTRTSFVSALFKVLKTDVQSPQEAFFSDVKSKSDIAPYVYTAAELGWVSKTSAFEPDRAITLNEALKILCEAMNYGLIAKNKGGYPTGYHYVANKLDLTDNLENASDTLDSKNAYILLFNGIISPTLRQVSFGDNEDYDTTGPSLLYSAHDVYVIEGIVTRTLFNSLTGAEAEGLGNNIEIDGDLYNGVIGASTPDMLGRKCRAYIIDTDAGKDTVLYLCDISEKLGISLTDISSYKASAIDYWLNDGAKKKTAKLASNCSYILNGRRLTEGLKDALSAGAGRIVLADNNNDNIYDCVYIERYSYITVKAYDTLTETITDSYHSDFTLDISEAVCTVVNLDGEYADVLDINPGNIYRVVKSMDGGFVSLVQIEGEEITGYNNGTEGAAINVDGESYVLTDYFSKTAGTLKLSQQYTYIMDGDIIITATENTGEAMYGYVIEADWLDGMETQLAMKIYNQNGKFLVYPVRTKLMLDGVTAKKDSDVYEAVNNNPQLIRFGLNSEGEINMVDLATTETPKELGKYDDPNNRLTKYEELSALTLGYYSNPKTMGMRYSVAGSKFFTIPADLSMEEYYEVYGSQNLTNNTSYKFDVYDINETGEAGVLVSSTAHYEPHCDNSSMVIKSINIAIDENGNDIYKIYGFKGTSFTTVYLPVNSAVNVTKSSSTGKVVKSVHPVLSSGDMINYAADNNGEIKSLRILFDAREGVFAANGGGAVSNPETANNWSLFNGMIYDVNSGIVAFSVVKNDDGEYDFSPENLRYASINTANICQYDCETTQIRNVDASTIKTYKTDGDNAQYVAVQANYFAPKMVAIYDNTEVR